MTTHRFERSLERGKIGEHIYRQVFAAEHPDWQLQVPPRGGAEDRRGVDLRVSFTVQVKYDEKSHRKGYIFVETLSNEERGTPGWALQCDAGLIAYIVPAMGLVLEFEPLAVKRMVEHWRLDGYREARSTNEARDGSTYHSVGLLVPIDVFRRIANVHVRYTILEDWRSRRRLAKSRGEWVEPDELDEDDDA